MGKNHQIKKKQVWYFRIILASIEEKFTKNKNKNKQKKIFPNPLTILDSKTFFFSFFIALKVEISRNTEINYTNAGKFYNYSQIIWNLTFTHTGSLENPHRFWTILELYTPHTTSNNLVPTRSMSVLDSKTYSFTFQNTYRISVKTWHE